MFRLHRLLPGSGAADDQRQFTTGEQGPADAAGPLSSPILGMARFEHDAARADGLSSAFLSATPAWALTSRSAPARRRGEQPAGDH